MTIPVWVATILVGAVLGGFSYLVKLIFDHDRRIERLEAWRENIRNNKEH